MTELIYARVQSALQRLKLADVAAQLDHVAEQAAREQWTYLTFLDRLLEAEMLARSGRDVAMKTKLAHLPFLKTLDQFDVAAQPSVNERQVRALAGSSALLVTKAVQWRMRVTMFPAFMRSWGNHRKLPAMSEVAGGEAKPWVTKSAEEPLRCRHAALGVLCCFFRTITLHLHQIQDHGMMHHAINCGQGGHRTLKNPRPFRKHQIGRDQYTLALVALGQQCEQHLHFILIMLDITNVVEDQAREAIPFGQFLRQTQIAFGSEEPLHQLGR